MGTDCPASASTAPRGDESPHPLASPPSRERGAAERGRDGDPSRAGALWIGATGVALLLAAAAVLTAVRWDDIGQTAKLSGLVAITLGLLVGGRRLRTLIPTTAQTLFHLGALLVPFDMAAVSTLAGQQWQLTLLTTSVTSAVVWYAILTIEQSPVLRWAARFGVAFAAAGVAAVAPVAAPLLLAPLALAAVVGGRVHAGAAWAVVAGLAPLSTFVPWPSRIAGAADDLGFVVADRWQLVAAGVIATFGVGAIARVQPSIEAAWTTVLLAAATVVTALAGGGVIEPVHLGIAIGFVGIELTALGVRRDADWQALLRGPLIAIESLTAVATLALLAEATHVTVGTPTAATIGVVAGMHVFGWFVADRRRLLEPTDWLVGSLFGADWIGTTLAAPLATFAAVAALTASSVALSIAGLVIAAWWLATRRTFGEVIAVAAIAVSVWNAAPDVSGLVIVLAGALVLNLGARSRRDDRDTVLPFGLATAAALIWLVAAIPLEAIVGEGWALALVACGAWALGSMLDDSWTTLRLDASVVGRVVGLAVGLLAIDIGEPSTVVALLGLAAFAIVDHHRSKHALFGGLGGGLGAAAIVSGLPLIEMTGSSAGLFLAMMGLASTAFACASVARNGPIAAAAAVVFAFAATDLASADVTALSVVLMIGAAAIAVIALARRDTFIAGGAAVVAHGGYWMLLADLGVDWAEAYLVLPALAALVAGTYFHRHGVSSWLSHAPVFALLGLVSIADRLTGGSAWHAVIAGAVGVIAVILGGVSRLIGPLLTGTAILAIVAAYESLGPASLVPTWAWLAIGGAVLLAAAVALERTDTTPLERGQQLRRALRVGFS